MYSYDYIWNRTSYYQSFHRINALIHIRGKARDDVWRWGPFDGAYSLVSRGDR